MRASCPERTARPSSIRDLVPPYANDPAWNSPPPPQRDLKALRNNILCPISPRILSLTGNPSSRGSKKLKGEENLYRLCVGDYRIIHLVEADLLLIAVIHLCHRGVVYCGLS